MNLGRPVGNVANMATPKESARRRVTATPKE